LSPAASAFEDVQDNNMSLNNYIVEQRLRRYRNQRYNIIDNWYSVNEDDVDDFHFDDLELLSVPCAKCSTCKQRMKYIVIKKHDGFDTVDTVYQMDSMERDIIASGPRPSVERGSRGGNLRGNSGPQIPEATMRHNLSNTREGKQGAGSSSLSEAANEVYQQQTTKFLDKEASNIYSMEHVTDTIDLGDAVSGADIQDFFSRPVNLGVFTWTNQAVGSNIITNMRPWQSYLTNTAIIKKLENFGFIRGNLHLKLVVNATPFFYGSARLTYQPLTILGPVAPTGVNSLIPRSQLPGAWFYPQSSKGCELKLPFIHPGNFLSNRTSTTSSDIIGLTEMGRIDLVVYNALASANATTPKISFNLYAWMSDVVLSGYTMTTVAQSEFKISSIASNLAQVTDGISKLPTPISRFASVGTKVLEGVSSTAKKLGYTNITSISDVTPMRVEPIPYMANSETGYPFQKLTVDPKNLLSIGEGITGVKTGNELDIMQFATRESYLDTFTFSDSTNPESVLWSAFVNPCLAKTNSGTNADVLAMPPLSFLARHFRSWRGDIIFRFSFIMSPYHKARIKIAHDPCIASLGNNIISVANLSETELSTVIYDVSSDSDIEFRVTYQQAMSWLYCFNLTTPFQAYGSAQTAAGYIDDANNGILNVRLLNFLSGPQAATTVSCNVFIRGAENFQVANPGIAFSSPAGGPKSSFFAYQSAETITSVNIEDEPDEVSIAPNKGTPVDHLYLTYMGENIESLMQILRRKYCLLMDFIPPNLAQAAKTVTIYPPSYGYDPQGVHQARNAAATNNAQFNYHNVNPISNFMACFLAVRGSMDYSFISSDRNTLLRATRYATTYESRPTAVSLVTQSSVAFANAVQYSVVMHDNRQSNLFLDYGSGDAFTHSQFGS